ncbi:MAG TPA: GIY-YIG nuclease family protein, partial [Solirubrobacterales bacterium]|nr:GIY-YIG nuclease family protein [Solirubrobacterales bacterium]
MAGASIRIFLTTGSPDGLRIVRKSNWTGVMTVTPRSDYREVRSRAEFTAPCVYVLVGPPEADSVLPQIYVGEGDQVRSRLDSHLTEKDFWTEAIVVTASDGSLNKAITRYMEARLIELAQTARRAELDNGNAPQLPPLSEADAADAEAFLTEVRSILPLLRVDA